MAFKLYSNRRFDMLSLCWRRPESVELPSFEIFGKKMTSSARSASLWFKRWVIYLFIWYFYIGHFENQLNSVLLLHSTVIPRTRLSIVQTIKDSFCLDTKNLYILTNFYPLCKFKFKFKVNNPINGFGFSSLIILVLGNTDVVLRQYFHEKLILWRSTNKSAKVARK